MSDPVLTLRHGSILEIALNRPDAYNALNLEMMKQLGEALSSAAVDDSIRGIVVTARRRSLCSCRHLDCMTHKGDRARSVSRRVQPLFHLSIVPIPSAQK